MRLNRSLAMLSVLALTGCGGDDNASGSSPAPAPPPIAPAAPTPTPAPAATPTPAPAPVTTAVTATPVARFDAPWAMVFLPDGRLLVTEKPGRLQLLTLAGAGAGAATSVSGVPTVRNAGQGGLLDVALDPGFAGNARVYLSFAEAGSGGTGLAVARGTLVTDGSGARLDGVRVIWRQAPKVSGDGHFGGRMTFGPDGHLFVTAGERQKGAPAQDGAQTLGKIVRLDADGSVPTDNPFAGSARPEVWTLGHRNPYGLVFARDGRLFETEMGPEGGDEFNLVVRGSNYGWPLVSEGNEYGGAPIPRHSSRPEFAAPLASWTPVIAPGGMIQYRGTRFVGWDGDFVLAGLVAQGLVRVRVIGSTAAEVARVPLGARIREVEQGPDGAIWVLEDGAGGRLVRLEPR